MDLHEIFIFITTGPSERVLGLVLAFLIMLAITGTVAGYILNSFFGIFKTLFDKIKRKEKVIEVPKYVTPPQNVELDKYLKVLSKIVEDNKNTVKL